MFRVAGALRLKAERYKIISVSACSLIKNIYPKKQMQLQSPSSKCNRLLCHIQNGHSARSLIRITASDVNKEQYTNLRWFIKIFHFSSWQ